MSKIEKLVVVICAFIFVFLTGPIVIYMFQQGIKVWRHIL